MPLSEDERKRERQLANLKRGDNPAPAGNRYAVTHGAFAVVTEVTLDEGALRIFHALAADAPLRAANGMLPAADAPMVRLAAEAWCRLDNVKAFLRRKGIEDADDQLRLQALEQEARLRRELADYFDALGMSPRSRSKLGLDLARAQNMDLAKAWADQDAAGAVIEGEASDA